MPKLVPVICLPEDEALIRRLEAKLLEYQERIQQSGRISTISKHFILSKLLESGAINTNYLRKKMREKYAERFSGEKFENACDVIESYCTNGGKDLEGGTGLPQVI